MRAALLFLVGLLVPSLLTGCGPAQAVVEVTLSGLDTSAIAALSIGATLDGRLLDGERRVVRPAVDTFDVRLAVGDVGSLKLMVGGLADSGCQVVYGEATVSIDSATGYQQAISLSGDSQYQGCSIAVTKTRSGGGRVTVSSPIAGESQSYKWESTDTSALQNSYTLGSKVTLTAIAEQGSYFAGWTGDCDGISSCTLTIDEQRKNVVAGFLPTELCEDGFCWEHPLPQGTTLLAAWGSASDDIWFTGEAGTMLHWNGVYTDAADSGTSSTVRSLWGSSPTDIWAVGEGGTILRWNGATWSTVSGGPGTPLYGVWGADASNVWAVGAGGTILKWNGTAEGAVAG